MKYLLTSLIICLSLSCSNNNDLTTELLNEKKAVEDSLGRVTLLQDMYERRAIEQVSGNTDTVKMHQLQDTSFMYGDQKVALQTRLKEITFSLDSLSKMK